MFVDENKTRPALLTAEAVIAEMDAYLASLQAEAEAQITMPGADKRMENAAIGAAQATRNALRACVQRDANPLTVFRRQVAEQMVLAERACWTNDARASAALAVYVFAWRKLNLLLAQTA